MSSRGWRSGIARITPPVVREWRRSVVVARTRRRNAARSTTDVFSEIYARGTWGRADAYDSGTGSWGVVAQRYAEHVRKLVADLGARSVVDVGCGDFRVAEQFVDCVESYHGVDVVPAVIQRNSERYGSSRIHFSVADAAVDPLPTADICLIRQVLQHLSNGQIAAILDRCRQFSAVVVTEHWPAPQVMTVPNRDKPHGPDVRLDSGSWVDIAAAPFHCSPVHETLRLSGEPALYHPGETIRTFVWRPETSTGRRADSLFRT
ncbi:class I SAM-dependent methyltransferase [Micromonospora sp. PLK6-60]|uniref:class I SAM-dependent methyltransferase n=1 Tax=Micromonospora sp. PLK6-60 TaxID=2873383 RepID=UPI001CA77263|nr:class I SAM-dependent methyltransferase [Micromonospora sp. PLK6-60]MBY8874820.1 class I SAM-dependent methyltransferase [Micromonospora sp. PLK6-60]